MTKIDLVTGFLGSGKTTFIKQYASYFINAGEHIGILENDFGAVNVDMMALSQTARYILASEAASAGVVIVSKTDGQEEKRDLVISYLNESMELINFQRREFQNRIFFMSIEMELSEKI